MIRTFIIPVLAIAGVVFALYMVVQGSRPPVATPPVVQPARPPFETFVAGSGLIEASTQNIAVGAPVGGLVMAVEVQVGQDVPAGRSLFRVDDRDLVAALRVREAEAATAESDLARLRLGTRPELIPPARAQVEEAQAAHDDLRSQLDMWERLRDPRAVSEEELSRRRFAVKSAHARLERARTDLALLEAGTWSPDLTVAQARLAEAQARVAAARTEIDRRVVLAPVEGRILQVNVRPGEFAPAGPAAAPLILMGSVHPLHIRVDIDENDAWRVASGSPAVAFVRGNPAIRFDLQFVRFEPYVIPKRSLTGESTERVDTRVLQVLYSFSPGDQPVYVGQQMDVFIKAPPLATSPPPATGDQK